MSFVRRLPWLGGLVLAAIAGATGLEAVRSGHAQQDRQAVKVTDRPVPKVAAVAGQGPEGLSTAFRSAARAALPGVVRVQIEAAPVAAVTPSIPRENRGTPLPPQVAAGSGFVFRSDGHIVTNNHVVGGASRVVVVLPDNREFEARVVGRDPNTDLAVVKIDATGLPVLDLGDSDAVEVGDWVIALGYPLQLGSTATAGIISAKGRSLDILRGNPEAPAPLENFLQTDAAINPGNSGGALVDLSGRVVGVNTAIATHTGFYSGYGFAIPINLARRVVDDLIRYGEVRRPRMGVRIDAVDPADAEIYRLPSIAGAEIVEVEPGTPAERAGLQMGDVVVAVNGVPIRTDSELTERVHRLEPGERVRLDIIRYGEERRIDLELGTFEPAVAAQTGPRPATPAGIGRLGFTAEAITPALARAFQLNDEEGVVITGSEPGSPAARAGLGRGLIIERINGQVVREVSELERVAEAVRPGDAVSLVVKLPAGDRRIIVNYRVRG